MWDVRFHFTLLQCAWRGEAGSKTSTLVVWRVCLETDSFWPFALISTLYTVNTHCPPHLLYIPHWRSPACLKPIKGRDLNFAKILSFIFHRHCFSCCADLCQHFYHIHSTDYESNHGNNQSNPFNFFFPGCLWVILFDISADISHPSPCHCDLPALFCTVNDSCHQWAPRGPRWCRAMQQTPTPWILPSIWGHQSVNTLAVILPCDWQWMGCGTKGVGLRVTPPDQGQHFGTLGVGRRRDNSHSCVPFFSFLRSCMGQMQVTSESRVAMAIAAGGEQSGSSVREQFIEWRLWYIVQT